jgi:hypothetical protein
MNGSGQDGNGQARSVEALMDAPKADAPETFRGKGRMPAGPEFAGRTTLQCVHHRQAHPGWWFA